MKRLFGALVAPGFALLLSAQAASATALLDFVLSPPTTGTISYAGGAAPLIGTHIDVDGVAGLDTPLNDGDVIDLSGYFLDFKTGPATGSWAWGSGNGSYIKISDGITDLMWGDFGSASIVYKDNAFHITGASFLDYKDPDLLEYFGLSQLADRAWSGNFNISFEASSTSTGSQFTSSSVLSGNVANAAPVPETGTIFIAGSGLCVLLGLLRRKHFLQLYPAADQPASTPLPPGQGRFI